MRPHSQYYQPENILVQEGQFWEKTGYFDINRVDELLDTPCSLWHNDGYKNDSVPNSILQANPPASSLYFIKPQIFKIHNVKQPTGSIQTRAVFEYSGVEYDLVVTDPRAKEEFLKYGERDYVLDRAVYLCISLGGEFRGSHYKLIAGVIIKETTKVD